MPSRSLSLTIAIAWFSCSVAAGRAEADPVIYDVTGVVAVVDDTTDLFGGEFTVGMPFTGP